MEADEEDTSKVSELSISPQDDALPLPHTGEELRNIEPQCHPEVVPELEHGGSGLRFDGESDLVPASVGRGNGDGIEGGCKEGDTEMEDVVEAVVAADETIKTDAVEDLGAAMEKSAADAGEMVVVEEETNVVEGHVTEETEVKEEMHVAGSHMTEETEVEEEMTVAGGHVKEETKVVEEMNVAEGHATEETEVGHVNENALDTEEKVLTEEAAVVNLDKEEAEESNVAETADETLLSMNNKTEQMTGEAKREEIEAETGGWETETDAVGGEDRDEVVGEEAEAEVELEEAEAEVEQEEAEAEAEQEKAEAEVKGDEDDAGGDDEEIAADMLAETNTVGEVDMGDDVMEETTEADETGAAEEEA